MATLLKEMNTCCEQARKSGRTQLSRATLKGFLARYDDIVEKGLVANPLRGSERDYVERKSYNLVAALRDLRDEVTLFARNLKVPFTENVAETPSDGQTSQENKRLFPGR